MTSRDDQSEYGGARGDNRVLPNGQMRRQTVKEQAQAARIAGLRNEPLPLGARPGIRVR